MLIGRPRLPQLVGTPPSSWVRLELTYPRAQRFGKQGRSRRERAARESSCGPPQAVSPMVVRHVPAEQRRGPSRRATRPQSPEVGAEQGRGRVAARRGAHPLLVPMPSLPWAGLFGGGSHARGGRPSLEWASRLCVQKWNPRSGLPGSPGGSRHSYDRGRWSCSDGRRHAPYGSTWCRRCSLRGSSRSSRARRSRRRYRRSNAWSFAVAVQFETVLATSTAELGSGVTVRVQVPVGVRVGTGCCCSHRGPARRNDQSGRRHETHERLLHSITSLSGSFASHSRSSFACRATPGDKGFADRHRLSCAGRPQIDPSPHFGHREHTPATPARRKPDGIITPPPGTALRPPTDQGEGW
jgi:hypothetical protein